MKGPEFLALMFSVYAFIGTLLNYNVLYAQVRKTRPWWLARRHSRLFYVVHKRLGWMTYVLTVLWFVTWIALFCDKGFWLASILIGMYLVTRIPVFFVLGPRTAFLTKHNALKNFGPTGRHEPSVVKSDFRIVDVDNRTSIL